MDQPWSGPDRLEPARPYSIRPDSPLHQQDGGLAAPRFLLLSTSDQATVRRNGHCHLQLLSGFACCHASLFQLVDADRAAPRQARDCPRLLRPRHVPARFLQHHLLGRRAGYGSVGTEVHQVRQHPDRLVPLPRLPLVVPVNQHPASLQGAGPLDHRLAAVGVLLLGADRLALTRWQAQGKQAAAARFLDLDLLQERDEGPRRLQPLDVLPCLLGNQVQVHGQAVDPAAPRRLLPRRTRSRRLGGRDDEAVVAVVHGAHYRPFGTRTRAGKHPLRPCPMPGSRRWPGTSTGSRQRASCCYRHAPVGPDIRLIRDEQEYRTKWQEERAVNRIPEDEPTVFLEVSVADASEFEADLEIRGVERFGYRVLTVSSAAVPNGIAAICLAMRDEFGLIPHVYFDWTEGSPLMHFLRFILWGSGEVAPVTREILRRAEPDRSRRPHVHVG